MILATSKNLTVLGIIAIVQALAVAAFAVFDGDPTTNVNFGLLISSIVAGVGMILAKGAQTTGGTQDTTGNAVVDIAKGPKG